MRLLGLRSFGGALGLLLLAMAGVGWAQETEEESPRAKLPIARPAPLVISKELAPGGLVSLKVNVGQVKIVPAAEAGQGEAIADAENQAADNHVRDGQLRNNQVQDNQVRLEIRFRRFADEGQSRRWVKEFTVAANRASIDLDLPKNNGDHAIQVTVYLPRQASLKVEQGVGDLSVGDVEGDKNLELGVGHLKVVVGDSSRYGYVHASTGIGDVNDPIFNLVKTGFLGKREEKLLETGGGRGRYRLRAHVHIGEVEFAPGAGTVARLRCTREDRASVAFSLAPEWLREPLQARMCGESLGGLLAHVLEAHAVEIPV